MDNNNFNQEPNDSAVSQQRGQQYAAQAESMYKRPAVIVIALILGILSILTSCLFGIGALFGILAIILAIIGKKKIEQRDGMCIASLVTGIIGTIISLIVLIVVVATGATLFPSASRYASKSQKASDIQTGWDISEAISVSLTEEDIFNEMQAYTDTVYSLSDDYYDLPESFVDDVETALGNNLNSIEPEYTLNGATGYAFMIDSSTYQVYVYISSDDYADEWEVSPDICSEYEY